MDIDAIIQKTQLGNIKWSLHASERIVERGISRTDIVSCITSGEIIEEYLEDYPYPSCLIYGVAADGRILHTVVGVDEESIYVITAYFPTILKFEDDLKTRRKE